MAVNLSEQMVFVVTCTGCGHREQFTDRDAARAARDEHYGQHRDSEEAGRRLDPSTVLDTDHPDVPWFGVIYKAAEHAQRGGWAYFTWNGRVFPATDFDLSRPVCEAKHVTGLKVSH